MTNKGCDTVDAASFRDPSGFIFSKNGSIYRQINKVYQDDYDLLLSSGLFHDLVKNNYLIPHKDISLSHKQTDDAYKIIAPEKIGTISYPYEWSFSQLQDAALLTLDIQLFAMEHGMSLKDATAYNIQFHKGKPIFIDTLSFEEYIVGSPWVAYRQFCQHFLAPLSLCAYTDIRLSQLLKVYIDGIPLDLVSSLLPRSTLFNLGLITHIHMHARSQSKYSDNIVSIKEKSLKMSQYALKMLLLNLRSTIVKLKLKVSKTEWGHYYTFTNYSNSSFTKKKKMVSDYIDMVKPKSVWDLGANTGEFTLLASKKKIDSVAWDIDPLAVEYAYQQVKKTNETHLLPLLLDLTNPSPGIGWAHKERKSFVGRGPVDLVMALAILHHLSLSNNVPFDQTASFFASLAENLIIEFVPKGDSQVDKLLKNREDIFDSYDLKSFENAYQKYFKIVKKDHIPGTKRTMYLMKRKTV
ncbi:MAG: SAM-dependent methyltransferase [Candidatus Roizmanbacteria bacterium]